MLLTSFNAAEMLWEYERNRFSPVVIQSPTSGLIPILYETDKTDCKPIQYGWMDGWMISFTLTPRKSDMQATTTIYLNAQTFRVFHFLMTNLEPRQGLPWPNCRSHC